MNDKSLSVSDIQQIVAAFESSPIHAQLNHAINILNQCQHATRGLDLSAFESVLGAMNTTQARTMKLLQKHSEMQSRLSFDDYWQLRPQTQELKQILTDFQERVEALSRRAVDSTDLDRRSGHRKLLMDIRFLLEEHNGRMLRSLRQEQQKVWKPSPPVAIIVWTLAYFVSLCSSVAVAVTFAYSSSARCDYTNTVFDRAANSHRRKSGEDESFFAEDNYVNDGVIPFYVEKIGTRRGPVVERTYFVWGELCDAQVIVADLQLFFKDRVLVVPSREMNTVSIPTSATQDNIWTDNLL